MSGQGPVRTASGQTASAGAAPSGAATTARSRSSTVPSGSLGSVPGRRGWRDLDARLLACSAGSPNGTVTSAVSSTTIGCSPPHRWPTSASPANAEPGCASSELYALDILDRFRPQAWGNPSPFHWVLGPLGAALVAAEAGARPRRSRLGGAASSTTSPPANASPTSSASTASSAALLRSARTRPGCRLDEWWSERRCAREWGEVVRPDGYGIWTEADTSLPFLLEYDNGTERLDRLAAKLDGYARLAAAAGHPNWVLFTFPSPRREADARRVLAHRGVPVATAVARARHRPRRRHLAPGPTATALGSVSPSSPTSPSAA